MACVVRGLGRGRRGTAAQIPLAPLASPSPSQLSSALALTVGSAEQIDQVEGRCSLERVEAEGAKRRGDTLCLVGVRDGRRHGGVDAELLLLQGDQGEAGQSHQGGDCCSPVEPRLAVAACGHGRRGLLQLAPLRLLHMAPQPQRQHLVHGATEAQRQTDGQAQHGDERQADRWYAYQHHPHERQHKGCGDGLVVRGRAQEGGRAAQHLEERDGCHRR
mmetsp:Transcript_35048/g.74793  ORF Transcript_35048/g.74793 Transcript_35048/m.74793 type:complete len:218 (-) Transcript_35048:586-1239(-)